MKPLIKICGIRDEETALFAVEAGADFIGFVHYPNSPRHVSIQRAAFLSSVLPRQAQSVLLLVDPDDVLLDDVKNANSFDLIQLHGHETPERTSQIRSYLNRPIIKAIRVGSFDDLTQVKIYEAIADWVLFDSKPQKPSLPGGTGETFDWSILEGIKSNIPWMLSGGLNQENVSNAVSSLKPYGIDVSSGIETIRGVKDMGKIKTFIDVLRNADITNI